MITLDYKPTDREIVDWTRRCKALAAELERIAFPPDENWLREGLWKGGPVDRMLAKATADTDDHARAMTERASPCSEADFDRLRSTMRRCLAAMDAWLLHHVS